MSRRKQTAKPATRFRVVRDGGSYPVGGRYDVGGAYETGGDYDVGGDDYEEDGGDYDVGGNIFDDIADGFKSAVNFVAPVASTVLPIASKILLGGNVARIDYIRDALEPIRDHREAQHWIQLRKHQQMQHPRATKKPAARGKKAGSLPIHQEIEMSSPAPQRTYLGRTQNSKPPVQRLMIPSDLM